MTEPKTQAPTERFFNETEKVRAQLMEGAITYTEWFNRIMHDAFVLLGSEEYFRFVNSPEYQSILLGTDPSLIAGAASTLEVASPESVEPSDFDALLEHHRATERENASLRAKLSALESSK